MTHLKRAAVAAAAAALLAGPLPAQSYFGKNQVQYDEFDWKVFETEHFLIHYYPEEREAAVDAARMAERAYGRLTRILDHQFREKKPIVLFASRSDFGQNNVLGDLGEGTGGVTEALRHRILLPFTGDYKSFERVLTHEMAHEFLYDIFARGKAGAGLQTLAQVDPPLWFAEGMAEYLALGAGYPVTNTVMRDAALNGRLPSIEAMTIRPDRFNPYEFGEALWAYIGARWGDEVIGDILNGAPNVGIERAFKRELGLSLEELSDEWRDAMQIQHLAPIETLDRPRKFAQPLLNERRSGGEIFLAPALSSDGKHIAFLSTGSFARGEVFIDLWLGDAETGKRVRRLVKSTTNPDFEELRLLYSQSAFSPDGRHIAFTSQRKGKDVLNILDVRRAKLVHRFNLPLEGVTGPTWSPDGRRLVFSGNSGGITDLYMVDVDGGNFRQLTRDRYGDLQPSWSPDGKRIAFASDRGSITDFDLLRFSGWRISVLDLEAGTVEPLPNQGGLNLNPQWAPDGQSLAFVSDRTGIQNLFLYDFGTREHYQLTNVIGGVLAATEYSPVISWAPGADRLAFTYYSEGDYTVWTVSNPRRLKTVPYRPTESAAPLIAGAGDAARRAAGGLAAAPPGGTTGAAAERAAGVGTPPGTTPSGPAPADTLGGAIAATPRSTSVYRTATGFRSSEELPSAGERSARAGVSVAALLDSFALALPDTAKFKSYEYKVRFQPDYVAQPSIGYAQDNFGRGVFGGTTIILSDLLGNHRLALSGEINGRVSEARIYAAYANLGNRFQYIGGIYQTPIYFLSGHTLSPPDQAGTQLETQAITRYIIRQAFATGIYPLNRFTRWELGARFNNIDRTTLLIQRLVNYTQQIASPFDYAGQRNEAGLNYVAPFAAFVSDNTLFGYTGPIFGRRYRFQIEPTVGSFRWVEYLGDYRRYDPIIFNYLTFATRVMTSVSVGRDEEQFPKYIGRPEFVRGYDRERFSSISCGLGAQNNEACGAIRLLGSRVAVANAELRFPLVRRFELGVLPIALPPVDGLLFADAGIAWSAGQRVQLDAPAAGEQSNDVRYPLTSYGFGVRLNLFGFAILRWDYAIPLNSTGKDGFWTWSIGPSF